MLSVRIRTVTGVGKREALAAQPMGDLPGGIGRCTDAILLDLPVEFLHSARTGQIP